MKALIIFVGLMFGNFVAEWIKVDPNFIVTVERSYFQGCALLTYWLFEKFIWKGEQL